MPLRKQNASRLFNHLSEKTLSREERAKHALDLAALLIETSSHEMTHAERSHAFWLNRMMEDPQGRTFLTAMADQCFRSQSAARTTDQILYLLKQYGIPRFLPDNERIKFILLRLLGSSFPGICAPLIRKAIRKEMASVLLPEDPKQVAIFFQKCREKQIRININHLGEAILGEEEAMRRLNAYLHDLSLPEIEYISIKISTLFSQINLLDFKGSIELLSERLRLLYREAKRHRFVRVDGSAVEKFINLDMEEYKDFELTVELFQKVLSEPEFLDTHAGIVLQSYLPESFPVQKQITEWAKKRVAQGGKPIKIRIVKGANLAMEAVEASIRGWEQAPFETKRETDANFKCMIEFGAQAENAAAVHLGIASHNVFDIAYALLIRAETKSEAHMHFEMLSGMAEPIQRVIHQLTQGILLYCPKTQEKTFHTAFAYLIRRLDENCSPENFLHHLFKLRPENPEWRAQADAFLSSHEMIPRLSHEKRRSQNRLSQPHHPDLTAPFQNEPDTDFALQSNRTWAEEIFQTWESKKIEPIPLVIGGKEIEGKKEIGLDPSRPAHPLYTYCLADRSLIDEALNSAKRFETTWTNTPFEKRSQLLGQAAEKFRERRAHLIGAMIADGGKSIWEADPEVSEAIDFIEYYRKNWEKQLFETHLNWSPKGTILVASPWNFPCSIPAGGIAAALTAGNCVIFKPAPEAVLVGWELIQTFWEAGIPKEALQFLNCKEEPEGSELIKHPLLASVILTGATQTARAFMNMRPELDLHAETGGKNVLIITAMSDRDLAIRDLVASAFGHSGQKCSACSLAILEEEVYQDPNFKRQLLDATSSLKVASAWDPSAKIVPLIRPPEGALLKGLTQLEKGESWLLKPESSSQNPHLWSPGIKWDVAPNSLTHQTEFFGPLLGVMRASSLKEAIELANATPYGLTSGLHSLDEREQEYWKAKIVAGNLYINRSITGAIVRRQPFGGCKASSFGSGAKAGGPHYVNQFAHLQQVALPNERASLPAATLPLLTTLKTFHLNPKQTETWKKSVQSYAYWAEILKEPTDPSPLLGQDNYFYHVPRERIILRIESKEEILPILQIIAACMICQTPLEISSACAIPEFNKPELENVSLTIETEDDLLTRKPERIRLLTTPSQNLQMKAAKQGILLIHEPVLATGRIELLHYLREVSLSIDYHRYGYLGIRDPIFAKK